MICSVKYIRNRYCQLNALVNDDEGPRKKFVIVLCCSLRLNNTSTCNYAQEKHFAEHITASDTLTVYVHNADEADCVEGKSLPLMKFAGEFFHSAFVFYFLQNQRHGHSTHEYTILYTLSGVD